MNKYNEFLAELFEQSATVLIAADLIKKLNEKFEVTDNYARQIISRAVKNKIIKSSEPFSFEKRQYFYMNKNQHISTNTLLTISRLHRKPLYRLLKLLLKTGGICSYYEAEKITATPTSNKDKYRVISLDEEIRRLTKVHIIKEVKDKRGIPFLILLEEINIEDHDMVKNKINAHHANMNRDVMFIIDIIRWLKNNGFISDQVWYRRKDNPNIGSIINDFPFDATTFTKTTGYSLDAGKVDDKNTIVVMDILIYRSYSKIDLDAFYDRIQSIRHSTKKESIRKIMPIIFYVDIEDNIKNEINNLHILSFSLKSIMGSKIIHVIEEYNNIKRIIDESLTIDEEKSSDVIEKISSTIEIIENTGQMENLQNLKGDLFEILMYMVLSCLFKQPYFEHSKIIKSTDDQKTYEFDIIVEDKEEDEVVVIELKGLKNTTIINLGDTSTNNTVNWFFGKTYPIAKKYYAQRSQHDKSRIKACYITSANFSNEAIQKLDEYNQSKKIKPTNFDCYYDRKKLLDLLKSHSNLKFIRKKTGFIHMLERYYLKESNDS